MLKTHNIFHKKNFLIYGLGKSGLSTFNFLKKQNQVFIYDDKKNIDKNREIKKNLINYKELSTLNIDFIVISPGIDIHKCNLKKFLKKNIKKIHTDLDIFFSYFNKNKKITITGTNGKSTTVKILYEVLKLGHKNFLLTLLNPKYAYFKSNIKFKNFNKETGKYSKIIKIPGNRKGCQPSLPTKTGCTALPRWALCLCFLGHLNLKFTVLALTLQKRNSSNCPGLLRSGGNLQRPCSAKRTRTATCLL